MEEIFMAQPIAITIDLAGCKVPAQMGNKIVAHLVESGNSWQPRFSSLDRSEEPALLGHLRQHCQRFNFHFNNGILYVERKI